MLYTEKEKTEIERVRKGVCRSISSRCTAFDLVWSDKVGFVWLAIWPIDPVYVDTGKEDRVCRRSLSRVPG